MESLAFAASRPYTLGVELELQLVSPVDCDLSPAAPDLLRLVERRRHAGDIKPEITESMIEVSTGIHERHQTLLAELGAIRGDLLRAADRLNVLVCGGGAHPFQHWSERRIFDQPRFRHLSGLYGYLAKQFTVFGQHVHVGCPDGDSALRALHGLARYVPHFIALAASSPHYQGVDTAFDSSRLNAVFAFPLSGRAPFVTRWDDFLAYFERMRATGVVASMKDFYWDIRPKPEYGTIEIRVCDTPLTLERAAALALYARLLVRTILEENAVPDSEDVYLTYGFNRFQACRFGLDGEIVVDATGTRRLVAEDVRATLARLEPLARDEDALAAIAELRGAVAQGNDARWIRSRCASGCSLPRVLEQQAGRWRGELH